MSLLWQATWHLDWSSFPTLPPSSLPRRDVAACTCACAGGCAPLAGPSSPSSRLQRWRRALEARLLRGTRYVCVYVPLGLLGRSSHHTSSSPGLLPWMCPPRKTLEGSVEGSVDMKLVARISQVQVARHDSQPIPADNTSEARVCRRRGHRVWDGAWGGSDLGWRYPGSRSCHMYTTHYSTQYRRACTMMAVGR